MPILAASALIAQVLCFVGLGYMFSDMIVLPDVLFPGRPTTASELAPYLLDTLLSYWLVFVVGAAGALTTWLVIQKKGYLANWFRTTARILGWIWIPLIPLGTVLGILILRSRSRAT